ncbi:MAG: sulfotransferase family 2 domain-containing protein [Paracoccaceae bacterium]
MDDGLNIIISEPGGIFYVLLPKCGSSSVVSMFLTMAGLAPKDRAVRDLARAAVEDGRLAKAGMQFIKTDRQGVLAARAAHPEHRLIANVRNPYDRILSSYYNKLNRYTKAFSKGIYAYGKARQLLEGPKSWRLVARGNAHMQTKLSFQGMLDGLERLGPDFDGHFARQSDMLSLNTLTYDRLLRLETFDADFRNAMADLGLPAEMLARLKAMNHSNQSNYKASVDALLTPQAKASIARIYAQDFSGLGYPL